MADGEDKGEEAAPSTKVEKVEVTTDASLVTLETPSEFDTPISPTYANQRDATKIKIGEAASGPSETRTDHLRAWAGHEPGLAAKMCPAS